MKNQYLAVILLVSCVSMTAAQEKEWTVQQVNEQLRHRYEMIDDAVVQFEQHVKLGFSNIEQNFSGVLKMRKPKCYRIESEHQVITTDGTTVWAYSQANKQVIIDNYKENGNSISPEQFMLNLPANYYASLSGSEKKSAGTTLILKLIPKDDRSFIKTVKLYVEANSWMVSKIIITDVNETETIYIVKDIKLNTNLKDKTFTFDTPPGAEVVDLR